MAELSRLMRPNLANRAGVDAATVAAGAAMEAGAVEEDDATRIIDQARRRRVAHHPEMASTKRFLDALRRL